MNKEEFINEFNDWTKEEILGRAFEICCKNIELKEIEKEHQRINGCLHLEIKELKEKLSKIETLIINHNCDTGDIYYKYNSKFLKSELKQRILEIIQGSDN